jgi:CubicO group peptidase (beta-lactamase class C family)
MKLKPTCHNTFRCCRIFLVLLMLTVASVFPAVAQSQREQIINLLNAYHEYGLFNGAVLVAKDGEVLFKGGFGDANKSWNIPNTADTKFRIASTTKQFTAALALKLVEKGKLELEGRVSEYLADYPPEQGNKVTVHHLLSHTSGIPSYTTPAFMSNEVRDPFTTDSLIALFSGLELQFEPGSRWSYSNSGYILLGAIIEAVTGKSYPNWI